MTRSRTPRHVAVMLLAALLLGPASCADGEPAPERAGDTATGPPVWTSPDASASGGGACTGEATADCVVGSVGWPSPPAPGSSGAPTAGAPESTPSGPSGVPSEGSGAPPASDRSSDPDPGSANPEPTAPGTLRVTGRLTYDDRVYDTGGFTGELAALPGQNVVVELVREADGAVVANTLTNADGRFALVAPAAPSDTLHVRALAAGRVGGLTTVVRDRTVQSAVYALRSTSFGAGEVAEVIALHAPAEQPIGGAMNITDVATEGFRFIAPWIGENASAPLTWRWQPGRSFPCGSCYRNNVVSLGGQIEDPDEYDDDIILHELGHWFVDHFSADTSPGGPHRDRLVSPELAYGEGLAYFFVGLVRDTPHIVDNFLGARRWIDMERLKQNGVFQANMTGTLDGTVRGDHREELVSGVLWHAYREPDGTHAFDRVHLGVEGHMRLLVEVFGAGAHPDVGARGIDLADWLLAAVCHLGVPAADLQAIVDAHDYPFAIETSLERCAEVRAGTPDHGAGKDTRQRRPPRQAHQAGGADAAPCALKAARFLPLPLQRSGDTVALGTPDGVTPPLMVTVELRRGAGTRQHRVRCNALPCVVARGVDDATSVVVTGVVGQQWSAGSWSGPIALERMLGEADVVLSPDWGALRVYRSAALPTVGELPGPSGDGALLPR